MTIYDDNLNLLAKYKHQGCPATFYEDLCSHPSQCADNERCLNLPDDVDEDEALEAACNKYCKARNEEAIREGFNEEDLIVTSNEIIKCDNQLEIDAIMELYTRAMKLAKEATSFSTSELWIGVAKEKASEIKTLRNTTEK